MSPADFDAKYGESIERIFTWVGAASLAGILVCAVLICIDAGVL